MRRKTVPCHTAQEMGPSGPRNSSILQMYLHSAVLFFRFRQQPTSPETPWGSFITWEGSQQLLSPSPSLIIRTDRLSGCAETRPPPSEPAQWLTEGSPAGKSRLGQAGPPPPAALPGWGCFLRLSKEMLSSRWRRQAKAWIFDRSTTWVCGRWGEVQGQAQTGNTEQKGRVVFQRDPGLKREFRDHPVLPPIVQMRKQSFREM